MNWLDPKEVQAWLTGAHDSVGRLMKNDQVVGEEMWVEEISYGCRQFARALAAIDEHAIDDVYVQSVEVARLLVKAMDGET